MALIRLSVTLPLAALDLQRQRIQQAVPRFQSIVQTRILPQSQTRTDASINRPLGAHRRPTDWQTPKQRRWWFAVGVTQWQGRKAKQDWTVQHTPTASGGRIVAVNPMPGAKYVFVPPYQQRMHASTWLSTPVYAQMEGAALLQDIADAWSEATTGGTTP